MTNIGLQITALDFDVLVKSMEVPEPIPLRLDQGIPINPMVFNHDWSVEVEIDTRWLTDVTQSVNQSEDRWVLANRPGRSMKIRVVGASKAESEAILQSTIACSSQFGFPVPIYPDGVEITAIDVSAGLIFGDFTNRRFYRGMRVVVIDPVIDPLQSRASARFATVDQIFSGGAKLAWNQGSPAAANPGQIIYPCMDVELVPSSSGVALTDGVYAVTMEFNEVDGSSSLPASWPFDLANVQSNLEPLCEVLDNYAVFPFNPNWSEEVQISTRRLVDSDRMGRTSAQTPSGEAFHEFDLSVMGYDRESCWRVARFFDAHRGRGRGFWFEHPMKPWNAASGNQTSVAIDGVGGESSFLQSYSKVVVTCVDGSRHIREIEWATEQESGAMWLGWTVAVPSAIASAQPIFFCRFDQDSISESWNTNTTLPSIQLRIVEDPKESSPIEVGELGFEPGDTNFTRLGDCTLLLRAGARMYNSRGEPALQWPASNHTVSKWYDSSRKPERDGQPTQNRPYFTAYGATSTLMVPTVAFQNNGQGFLANPAMRGDFFLDSSQPINDKQLWDTVKGWTICFVITPQVISAAPLPPTRRLFEFASTGEFVAALTMQDDPLSSVNGYRSWMTFGPLPAASEVEVLYLGSGTKRPAVYCLQHSGSAGGNIVRLWVDGLPAAPAFASPLVDVTRITSANLFTGNGWPQWAVGTTSASTNWNAGNPAACLVASYKEALPLAELRELHSVVSKLYLLGLDTPNLY